jgi:hypothetical protein
MQAADVVISPKTEERSRNEVWRTWRLSLASHRARKHKKNSMVLVR